MRSKFKQYIYEFRGREIGDNDIFFYFYQEIIDFKGSRVQTKSKYTWILKYPFSFKPFSNHISQTCRK